MKKLLKWINGVFVKKCDCPCKLFIGNGIALGSIKASFYRCNRCGSIEWRSGWVKGKYISFTEPRNK